MVKHRLVLSRPPYGLATALLLGVAAVLSPCAASATPVLQVQLTETGCGASCPAPVTLSDHGTGLLTFPTNFTFGAFKLNGGQIAGLMFAIAATPNQPNSDILDPGANVLISIASGVTLVMSITQTGLVAQDAPVVGFYFNPGITMSPGSTMTVATFVDATDTAFGRATTVPLTATSVPSNVTSTNNADGSVTFVNHDATHQKSPQADSTDFVPVAMSTAGDFSITEVITLSGPKSAIQARLSGSFAADPPVYAPEPTTLVLFGSGVVGWQLLVSRARGRRRRVCRRIAA